MRANWPVISVPSQSRHFDRGPATSDLPPGTDIVSPGRHVSNLPKTELAGMAALGAKRSFVSGTNWVQRFAVARRCNTCATQRDHRCRLMTLAATRDRPQRQPRPGLLVVEEMQQREIEKRGILQEREVTGVGQDQQPSVRDRGGDIFCMCALDRFVMVAVDHQDLRPDRL
jgi:hypothetical protein